MTARRAGPSAGRPGPAGPGAGGAFADFGPPRRVDDGLRARSTRGAIGVSWWSRRFLEVLESFALGTRLTRGRAYARRGQVRRLVVSPGRVEASVQGSRPAPYPVVIALPPFPDPLWARVERELAGQAFFSARLLAGDLPAELEEVFAAAGAPLFPASVGELTQHCGCPDFAVPCKHLAATFYLLAEAFDADPFALLHWRGRSRDELLGRLRTLRAGTAGPSGSAGTAGPSGSAGTAGATGPAGTVASPEPAGSPDVGGRAPGGSAADPVPSMVDRTASGAGGPDPAPAGAARVLADLPDVPLSAAVDRFWLPPVPLPDRPAVLATGPELLLRQLGAPAPEIGGPGLLERLRRAYQALDPG
ncbi:SWIM zinc finger family protein [Micromonospora sp. WMMD714]|uniref:SWIM zinc finger family protein n=1 Tax=Micromonospora sp. WMMD714 TaxID=3016097 RepID=UPI002499AF88|nr:SWIM zinc finger family protein [Micromonospora sp. WMMD714]WFE67209.1 SWIM zinc finger family protein [Micromonospora sp. WMMD714]